MMFVGSKHEDNNGQPPPHRNWVIVLLFNVLTAILFTIMAPFLYQFITSPKSRPIDHDEVMYCLQVRLVTYTSFMHGRYIVLIVWSLSFSPMHKACIYIIRILITNSASPYIYYYTI